MADYLDQGLIINILHRLPVKTLLRCTSVCKSWYSLITSNEFISSQLKFSAARKNNTCLLLVRRWIRDSERYNLYSDNESFTRQSTLQFPFRSINSFFTIVGTCNGLLCLSDDRVYYTHTIILWNPCIKMSLIVPKPNPVYNSHGTFTQLLGFGFDQVASDYKVVRITYVDYIKPHVELYKLSTGVWQEMSYLELEYVIYKRSRQAYVNGATHWIACCPDSCDLIVFFDMCCEVFGKMLLPISCANNDPVKSKDLMVYMESLALVLWNVSGVEPSFTVCVMKEYGVEDSWTKHLNLDFHNFGERFTRPLWVRKHGEVVTVRQNGHLISYDPNGGEVKNLGVRGSRSEDYRRSVHVDSYVKSLALLERGPCFADAVTCSKLPATQNYNCDSLSSYESDDEYNSATDYKCSHESCSGNRAM